MSEFPDAVRVGFDIMDHYQINSHVKESERIDTGQRYLVQINNGPIAYANTMDDAGRLLGLNGGVLRDRENGTVTTVTI